jgi:hypothetical protein
VARLLNSAIALLVTTAVLVAGPIGSGGLAVAAAGGAQESRLQREVDRMPAGERVELERQLAEGIAAAGIDLHDPTIQNHLAQTLGVTAAEIDRAVNAVESGSTPADSVPIVFIFVAAALIFAPSVFRTVAGTLYGWLAEISGIGGIEPF